MKISGILYDTIKDGPGLRNTIFVSGCNHKCKGCHNPETWDKNVGQDFTKKRQLDFIEICKRNALLSGITISGGDPLCYYKDEVLDFIKLYKEKLQKHNIWLYTGYEMDIKDLEQYKDIDVIVDGKFDLSKKDLTLAFRGSSNQRIIDVKKSLEQNKICEVYYNE